MARLEAGGIGVWWEALGVWGRTEGSVREGGKANAGFKQDESRAHRGDWKVSVSRVFRTDLLSMADCLLRLCVHSCVWESSRPGMPRLGAHRSGARCSRPRSSGFFKPPGAQEAVGIRQRRPAPGTVAAQVKEAAKAGHPPAQCRLVLEGMGGVISSDRCIDQKSAQLQKWWILTKCTS